jgi:hypothetical protein
MSVDMKVFAGIIQQERPWVPAILSGDPTVRGLAGTGSKRIRDSDTNLPLQYPSVVQPYISRLSLSALGLSALVLVAPRATWSQQVAATPERIQDADEYAVRSVVLTNRYVTESVKEIVVRDQTARLKSEMHRLPTFRAATQGVADITGAVADLDAKSQVGYPVENDFSLKVPCILFSKEAENDFFHYPADNRIDAEAVKKIQVGWQRFHRDHPDTGGLITVSRVGFDSDRTLAVVYVDVARAVMSADGKCFLLVKKNGSWVIVSEEVIWFA